MALSCASGDLDWMLGIFFTERVAKHWNSCPGVTIPGNIKRMCGFGTGGYGLIMSTMVLG